MSYSAYTARLQNIRPHPNADRLDLADVLGFQVVIGKGHYEGEMGIFFPTDGQLSQEFAEANDLIGKIDPATGERSGGFFDEKRKVRAQKFRGVKSEGFWMPLSALDYLEPYVGFNKTSFNEGDPITELYGHEICRRYETPHTRKAAERAKQGIRPETRYFPKHFETGQFLIEASQIPVGSRIIISEKLHGTSHREGRTWIDVSLPWYKRLINYILRRDYYPEKQLQNVIGTRNTTLSETSKDYHNDKSFRYAAAQSHMRLNDGELLYGEIVGYTSSGQLIMPAHNNNKTKDKEVTNQYGPEMRYTYGTKPGESTLYAYRIATINEYGLVRELPYDEFVKRAEELGVKIVPLMADIKHNGDIDQLKFFVERLSEGSSYLDKGHIKEGVVLRIETPDNGRIYFLKYKSFLFRVLEGIAKEDDTYVDTEEAS